MLLVVSDTSFFKDEAVLINALFDEGLEVFHLRKPLASESETQELIRQIKPEHIKKIALHAHHQLAAISWISRLHYTEEKRKNSDEKEWQALKESGYRLSTSIHQATEGVRLSDCFDYAFLGPVFDSISKPNYTSVIPGNFKLPEVKTKLIAIGGIKENNITTAREMGFDGVAVLGSIWHSNDPVKSFQQIKKAWNSIVQ